MNTRTHPIQLLFWNVPFCSRAFTLVVSDLCDGHIYLISSSLCSCCCSESKYLKQAKNLEQKQTVHSEMKHTSCSHQRALLNESIVFLSHKDYLTVSSSVTLSVSVHWTITGFLVEVFMNPASVSTRRNFTSPNLARSAGSYRHAGPQGSGGDNAGSVLVCVATVCMCVWALCQHWAECWECLHRYAAARVVIQRRKPTFIKLPPLRQRDRLSGRDR